MLIVYFGIVMKQTLILACAVLLTSCHAVIRTHDSGERVEVKDRVVSVNTFERVDVAGSFSVSYRQTDSCTIRVQAPEDVLEELDIRSDGNTLRIGVRDRLLDFSFKPNLNKVKVFLTSPDLIEVQTAGDVEFKSEGNLDTDNLQLSVAGVGKMDFNNVICDAIDSEIAGSGGIFVKNLTTGTASFEIAGSGDIGVHFVQGKKAKVQIAGSGNVKLSGRVKKYEQDIAGLGNIDTKDLIVE